MPGGRPTNYSLDLAKEICELLAEGETLTKICKRKDMPCFSAVNKWLHEHKKFMELYQEARLLQADYRAQEIYNLPFECEAAGLDAAYTKLKMDGAKWAASKGNPKLYGDSTQIKHADADGEKINVIVNKLPFDNPSVGNNTT
jgi:hypothetical protein